MCGIKKKTDLRKKEKSMLDVLLQSAAKLQTPLSRIDCSLRTIRSAEKELHPYIDNEYRSIIRDMVDHFKMMQAKIVALQHKERIRRIRQRINAAKGEEQC